MTNDIPDGIVGIDETGPQVRKGKAMLMMTINGLKKNK